MSKHLQENQRLAALKATRLLDSAPEEVFDRLTKLAARALNVPIALISLVDANRQFFKSQVGLPPSVAAARETPLSHSFCQHVVATHEPLIVEDARRHELLASNLAVRDLNVIAYAGVPMMDADQNCLGSLCAIEQRPRAWTRNEIELLKGLATVAMTEIELRKRTLLLGGELFELREREADRSAEIRLTIHDLRTPLNSLILNLQVLAELDTLTPVQLEWLKLTESSADALKQLVDNLVANEASGRHGGTTLSLAKCDPQHLTEGALDQVRGVAHSKNISLEARFQPKLAKITADAHKLSRVLVNLLGNAIKFTPPTGCVSVTVNAENNKQIIFSVTDTGIGFDETLTSSLFEKGTMLDKHTASSASNGWGLEYCKRVIDLHGGTIQVKSSPGNGSVFSVIIPLTRSTS